MLRILTVAALCLLLSTITWAEFLLSGFSGNHVKRYDAQNGTPFGTFVVDDDNGLNLPHELLFGPDLNMYVCSAGNDAIYRYDGFSGIFVDMFVPTGSGGLDYPASMVWGPDGHLYVASQLSNEILRYNGSSGAFMDAFVTVSSGGLNGPSGLLFGPNSNLFVAARFGNQVLEYNGSSGAFVQTFVNTNLNQPFGLDFGPDGNLYVASGNDNLVQRFNGMTGAFIDSFVTNNLSLPVELEFGPDSNLYVASFSTGSIERFHDQTGQWIDRFVVPGPTGVNGPNFFTFRPPQIHPSGTVRFIENATATHEYGQQLTLPDGFGSEEFTLEFFVRLDNTYPTGPTSTGTNQLINWFSGDPTPYSSGDWWFDGNFLLDGHNNNDFSAGTFSVQFYGEGRLRWLLGDGGSVPTGGCWAVQAHPATNVPTLLDGAWHQVALVRRWTGLTDAQLEVWVDTTLIAQETSDARIDLYNTYWNNWPGFPVNQEGWFWGSEKQAAFGLLPQYEDFKGFLDEIRFWNRPLSTNELTQSRLIPLIGVENELLERISFSEQSGNSTVGNLTGDIAIVFSNHLATIWQHENTPFDADNDTLPDWWETHYYGHPTNTLPSSDTDLDQSSAYDERWAGTDPTNSNSVLSINSIAASSNVAVSWQSIGGKQYRVEYSDNLTSGFIPIIRTRISETELDTNLDEESVELFIDDGSITNEVGSVPQRTYRVLIVP